MISRRFSRRLLRLFMAKVFGSERGYGTFTLKALKWLFQFLLVICQPLEDMGFRNHK